ncbi:sensor histidine kinase [Sorangium cellulosum]|uniref:sensor histidine kinase n=1 Tax=Sorangium cellulosum TaxID=56 RepID=UPI0023DDD447|nr:ATP-binding protein [Sorangium cellulosum]
MRKKKERLSGGGFTPVIRLATAAAHDAVEIRVRDNGVGIPRDLLDVVCNPFFTTKEAGEGTGLGLSLSHDIIVKGYGGSLRIDSIEGDYTEVAVSLPRR